MTPTSGQPRRRRWSAVAFVLFMLALTAGFLWLGMWQLQRLQEKDALVAAVTQRLDAAPVGLPDVAEWDAIDWEFYDYRPVHLEGRFRHEETVLVFTSLSQPKGRHGGPGYWVMTPFDLARGGTVFVNRGFVPQDAAAGFGSGATGQSGTQELVGLARASEGTGSFAPDPDRSKRIDWTRDIDRLALFLSEQNETLAQIYVDLPAGPEGALPQGGETRLEFTSNHLGYAMTWFGFALLTPILLIVWLFAQRRAP